LFIVVLVYQVRFSDHVPVIRSCETVNWVSVSVKAKLRDRLLQSLLRTLGEKAFTNWSGV
jgi:hypothetical protein